MSQNLVSAPSRGALITIAALATLPALVIVSLAAVLNWGR